jgi:antitoxin CptB
MTNEKDHKQTVHEWRKRLKFRSWHRGTREMDLLMGSFADEHLPHFTEAQLKTYEEILGYSDPDLYIWYTGKEPIPANVESDVLTKFKNHKYSFPDS